VKANRIEIYENNNDELSLKIDGQDFGDYLEKQLQEKSKQFVPWIEKNLLLVNFSEFVKVLDHTGVYEDENFLFGNEDDWNLSTKVIHEGKDFIKFAIAVPTIMHSEFAKDENDEEDILIDLYASRAELLKQFQTWKKQLED
jgi:hypothetical protein